MHGVRTCVTPSSPCRRRFQSHGSSIARTGTRHERRFEHRDPGRRNRCCAQDPRGGRNIQRGVRRNRHEKRRGRTVRPADTCADPNGAARPAWQREHAPAGEMLQHRLGTLELIRQCVREAGRVGRAGRSHRTTTRADRCARTHAPGNVTCSADATTSKTTESAVMPATRASARTKIAGAPWRLSGSRNATICADPMTFSSCATARAAARSNV